MTGRLKDIYHHMLKIFELHQSHKMAYSQNCDGRIYMCCLVRHHWDMIHGTESRGTKTGLFKTVLIQISKSNIYLKVFICILSQIFYLSLYQMLQNQNRLNYIWV